MVEPAAIVLQRARAADAKKRRRDVEGATHRAVLHYLRTTLPYGFLVQHTPNNPRSMMKGAREKANGAIAGWPDLAIYGPGDAGPTAWFMEIKPPYGSGLKKRFLSEGQIECHSALVLAGFNVCVVRSVEDARKAVSDWRLPSNDSLIVRREA